MKKWNWKKVSAIGASMALALSLTFGLVFSDISLNDADKEETVNNKITESIEGGVPIKAPRTLPSTR